MGTKQVSHLSLAQREVLRKIGRFQVPKKIASGFAGGFRLFHWASGFPGGVRRVQALNIIGSRIKDPSQRPLTTLTGVVESCQLEGDPKGSFERDTTPQSDTETGDG